MIVVIADDFTGAAELAGISLRYGLSVELVLGDEFKGNTDVLVVCTDSRSLSNREAIEVSASIAGKLADLKPSFIYKKIDSVLRGHVLDELQKQQEVTGFDKVIILPANPSLGRTIENGEYFIEGKRINETGFVNDPEFPIRSSSVKEMLGGGDARVLTHMEELPAHGIVIAETGSMHDVRSWVDKIDESWMLVGAGDFYSALLGNKYAELFESPVNLFLPHLYVCGTAFKERKDFIKKLDEQSGCVVYLPGLIDEHWLTPVAKTVQQQKRLVLAIDEVDADAVSLRSKMAEAVKSILKKEKIKEIFIEGGSTAAAVLQELNLNQFTPVNELQRGVVRMKAGDLYITVKPGSYQLSKEIEAIYHHPGSV